MGAENPLIVDTNGLATRWKVFDTTSFRCAVDPVVIAMCAAAVNEGLTVVFCSATAPSRASKPSPLSRGMVPSRMNSLTSVGVPPSSEITTTRGAANEGSGTAIAAASKPHTYVLFFTVVLSVDVTETANSYGANLSYSQFRPHDTCVISRFRLRQVATNWQQAVHRDVTERA